MKVTEVKLIWESELSELVRETYGRPYQLQQQGDVLSQDSLVRITVPAERDFYPEEPTLESWYSRDLDEVPDGEDWDYKWSRDLWWTREFYPDLQDVVNDLHEKGLMEAGDYVIHGYW